jgi:hypothetical protein
MPGDVYNLTPREWDNHIKGYDKRNQHKLEYDRMFFAQLVNIQVKEPISPDKMFPFHWEQSTTSTGYFTPEMKAEILEKTKHW